MEDVIIILAKTNTPTMQAAIKRQTLLVNKKELTSSDKGLLQKMVKLKRPKSKNYDDSWGYVIQATRYKGFRLYDPRNNALIFFGRKSGSDPRLVIPTFFAEPKYLANVLDILQRKLKITQTILKNVNSEEIKSFLPYGFRPYTNDERWDSFARFDDQTYPQLVIKLEHLSNHKGGHYKNLRTALHKNLDLVIRKYSSDDKDKVLDLFVLKDGITNDVDRTKGMYYVSHAMYPTADIDKYVISDKITGEIIGFTATSDISPRTTALVASIFKPGVKVASVWGIYHTLLIKYHEKYQFVNLGGNETAGTYNFMRRTFQSFKEISKTHLVYDPQK